MKSRLAIFILSLCIILSAVFIFSKINAGVYEKDYSFTINNKDYSVILVNTTESKTKGLGGMMSLPENKTMLFTFDEADKHGIWMKDMNFPIDIIWMNNESKIVHIEKNVSPNTYPKIYTPKEKSSFVLETNAGFTDSNNLSVGNFINIIQK